MRTFNPSLRQAAKRYVQPYETPYELEHTDRTDKINLYICALIKQNDKKVSHIAHSADTWYLFDTKTDFCLWDKFGKG